MTGAWAAVDRPRGHRWVKTMAAEMGVPMPALLALARGNDPFACGTPADQRAASWFASLWDHHGAGGHLRRLHYQLLSTGATDVDGTPYTNTEECWGRLAKASAAARSLGLVDPTSLVDRRNARPVLNPPDPRPTPAPEWEPWWPVRRDVPSIDTDVAFDIDYTIPAPAVLGYDYAPEDQPVLVELWIEKSTMNDVLVPLCEALAVNLVASIGFQSITGAVDLLHRAARADKPTRVLYISDFDPAGIQMPVAVARQIEFWIDTYAPAADIKVTPIALTADQIDAFELPRVPIKESDRRRAGFESHHGSGAVELDALEALHPGALATIVREACAPYRDATLPRRLAQAGDEARSQVREAWEEVVAGEQAALDEISDDIAAVAANYQTELDDLAERMGADMAGPEERLQRVWRAIHDRAAVFEVDLPPRPVGEIGATDEATWLFDSRRPYLAQLHSYRAHRNGGEAR